MTQGAINASGVRPAISVCVPQRPNGASISSRMPRCALPRRRVRLVFTAFGVALGPVAGSRLTIDEDNAFGPGRNGRPTAVEPVRALLFYLGATAFGGSQPSSGNAPLGPVLILIR